MILIVAMVTWASIMLAHPAHGGGPSVLWRFSVSDLVHAIGLIVKPVLAYAFYRLAFHQGIERPLVALALSFFIFGQLAMLSAGAVSGWITPSVLESLRESVGGYGRIVGSSEEWMAIGRFSSLINQGFAQVYTALVSCAILLWSLAWTQRSNSDRAVQLFGLFVGGGLLLWQLSGAFIVSAATMVVVAMGQTAWAILAALRTATARESIEHAHV